MISIFCAWDSKMAAVIGKISSFKGAAERKIKSLLVGKFFKNRENNRFHTQTWPDT